MYLRDLPVANPDRNLFDRQGNLAEYIALPEVAKLEWPASVIEQWLFDHGGHAAFLEDYGSLDLSGIGWALEKVVVAELEQIRTGPSEQEFLSDVAQMHRHWLSVRPPEIRSAWEETGTWLVPPILIARDLLSPCLGGLQVVEGRMRVGILQGRRVDGLRVADSHQAWVGRALATRVFRRAATV